MTSFEIVDRLTTGLPECEARIMQMTARGSTSEQIAEELELSEPEVVTKRGKALEAIRAKLVSALS